MIKKLYLLPLLLLVLSFVACNETEEYNKYANWKERNDAFIDSLQRVYDSSNRGKLERIQDSKNKKSYIYFKRMESNPDNSHLECPFYTSKVTTFYRGMYINEDVFSMAEAPDYFVTKLYDDADVDIFDQNFKGADPSSFDTPTSFSVNEVINGWTEVLQKMKPGDRVELYVPYASAYGENSSSSKGIMDYSALVFDVQLLKVDEY